jgi:hypothetical protein
MHSKIAAEFSFVGMKKKHHYWFISPAHPFVDGISFELVAIFFNPNIAEPYQLRGAGELLVETGAVGIQKPETAAKRPTVFVLNTATIAANKYTTLNFSGMFEPGCGFHMSELSAVITLTNPMQAMHLLAVPVASTDGSNAEEYLTS